MMTKLLSIFKAKGDWLKLELLEGLRGQPITFYEQGNSVDLAEERMFLSTGRDKNSRKLLSIAGACCSGDEKSRPDADSCSME